MNDTFESLTPEQRSALADLIEERNELMRATLELNRRKVNVLRNYSPEAEEELSEFSSIFIAPMRARNAEKMTALIGEAIDTDKIKALLPMILMGVSQGVNVPLLLTTLGLDPDMIKQLTDKATDYFQKEM